MKASSQFPDYWNPPKHAMLDIDRVLYDLAHVEILDEFGVDIRSRAYDFCRLHRLSERDTDLIMEPYHNGFWRVSDGLSSPMGLWQGRARDLDLHHHPVAVRHDFDWRINAPFRMSNTRFRRLAAATDFTVRESRVMYFAVSTLGMPVYAKHVVYSVLDPTYTVPPWLR